MSQAQGFSTERLVIRRFTEDDAAGLLDVLGDAEVMRFSDHGPLDAVAVSSWLGEQIAAYAACPELGRWAICRRGDAAVIGYIGLTRAAGRTAEGEAELGFRLARSRWGKGYASEAARAVLRRAFARTRIEHVIAIVDPHNQGSVRVLEKLGLSFLRTVTFEGYDHPDHVYGLGRPGA